MRIQESFNNRTNKYLGRILQGFGKVFIKELQDLTLFSGRGTGSTIEEYALRDILYDRAKGHTQMEGSYVFLVFDIYGPKMEGDKYVDTKKGREKFLSFLKFARGFNYYVDDYWFGKGKQCIVFDVRKYKLAYDMFIVSKYSAMYTPKELIDLGFKKTVKANGSDAINLTYSVLTKGDLKEMKLQHEIQKYYATDTLPDNPSEFDIPWFPEEEILNYKYAEPQEIGRIKTIKQNGKSFFLQE